MDEDIQELETKETQSHPSTEVAKDNSEKHEEVVASYVDLKWGLETFNKDVDKGDPALNKKVLEAAEAYI
ncbi:hypothetical protein Tco_1358472 [Tanacetum coccineum]